MADGEWQLVRRKRPRPMPQRRDRGYEEFRGWKDRALPVSFGRRDQVPYPNRPAPPPRDSRYPGPQNRSYAEAVRSNLWPARRWVPPRASGPEVRRESANPQLRKLIRKLNGVIRQVHHWENVAPKPGKQEPRMISRMVEILADMIKPAAPTERTVELITANAKNWGYTTYQILMEHYEAGLEDLLEELSGLLTPDWKEAFAVAVRWAKRNLPRLSQEVIERAEALVTSRMATTTAPTQAQVPVLGEATTAPVQELTQVPQQAITLEARLQEARVPRQPVVGTSVATMTDLANLDVDGEPEVPRLEPPREQREARRRPRTTGGVILMEDHDLVKEPELVPAEEVRGIWEREASDMGRYFDELDAQQEREAADAFAVQDTVVDIQVHREEVLEEDIFEESFDRFTDPEPPRYRVHRHPNTQRKLTDWNLVVTKKCLIVGDSNLSNFPDFFNKDLQVECYPGSHFRHAQALMEKTIPSPTVTVEKVILAFGINGRENKAETTIKNVQGALRSTKRKFPYAQIWIPKVNFSPHLPGEEQDNLESLNLHLERNMPYIPLLPEDRFQTEADDIHWTPETARAIFEHWMTTLNSSTP